MWKHHCRTHIDPCVAHKNEDGKGSQENSSDGIPQHLQGRNNNKRCDRSIALQMWPSGYYVRPKGKPQVPSPMKIKEGRNQDEWEIQNHPGSPFWNDLHINNEWMVFMTPSNNIIEEEMEIGRHGWQVKDEGKSPQHGTSKRKL